MTEQGAQSEQQIGRVLNSKILGRHQDTLDVRQKVSGRMLWFLTTVSLILFISKAHTVWRVSRDPFGGCGTPTRDFPIVYPVLVAAHVTVLLRSEKAEPFPYFGVALWLFLVSISLSLTWLFEYLGEPKREIEMRSIHQEAAEKSEGSSAAALRSSRST